MALGSIKYSRVELVANTPSIDARTCEKRRLELVFLAFPNSKMLAGSRRFDFPHRRFVHLDKEVLVAIDFPNNEDAVILVEFEGNETTSQDAMMESPWDRSGALTSSATMTDWFEEALKTPAPVSPKRLLAAWDDEDEEEEDEVDEPVEGESDLPNDGAGVEPEEEDPFFDFDEDDFDDDFDDDFEEELDEEYDIEPDDDGMLEEDGDDDLDEDIDPDAPLDEIVADDE